jgi:hypothetical protein
MKKLVLIAAVVALGWYGHDWYRRHQGESVLGLVSWPRPAQSTVASFRCDGRTHCSHMTSYAEMVHQCPWERTRHQR